MVFHYSDRTPESLLESKKKTEISNAAKHGYESSVIYSQSIQLHVICLCKLISLPAWPLSIYQLGVLPTRDHAELTFSPSTWACVQ